MDGARPGLEVAAIQAFHLHDRNEITVVTAASSECVLVGSWSQESELEPNLGMRCGTWTT